MIKPDNEQDRMAALRMFNILDTEAEKQYDNVTKLASEICETPISLVSLIDEDRQWFKSKVGLDTPETPRDQAFCAHAIMQDDIMVVEDASNDPRFAHNPLVTSEPNIRFYAGAPLIISNDIRLGTLCVIDRKPRRLSSKQMNALSVLRESVVTLLELRHARLGEDHEVLPMCAWCHSIRMEANDGELWLPLHKYVMDNTVVSHGICPRCRKKHK